MTVNHLNIKKPSGYELHASWYNTENENLVVICHGGFGDRNEQGRFPVTAEKLAEIVTKMFKDELSMLDRSGEVSAELKAGDPEALLP